MPTYEYKCEQCGQSFEVFQKMTDKPVKKCPECGGKARKLISGGCGLIFKGSGFYITDYKKKNVSCAKESGTCSKPSCSSCESAESKKEKKESSQTTLKKD